MSVVSTQSAMYSNGPRAYPGHLGTARGARFAKLHERVVAETGERNAKPRLDAALDRYLRTLWQLSLAAPLDYSARPTPFDLTGKEFKKVYLLSNGLKGAAEEDKLGANESVRERFGLKSPVRASGPVATFEVFVDDVKLARPLAFEGLPATKKNDPAKTPLLFVGKFDPNLTSIPAERSGGQHLSFESYMLWTPRVVPTDHIGVMIRIADASGTLFDNTFMGYQVAEIQRLAQISSEVFVLQGLDSALNIDRESFNFGHPHAKLVASWVHRALRQVATLQKKVVKEVRDVRRGKQHTATLARADAIVEAQLDALGIDSPLEVMLVDDPQEVRRLRQEGTAAFQRTSILGEPRKKAGAAQRNDQDALEKRMEALIMLLDAYGLLQRLPYARQQTPLTR